MALGGVPLRLAGHFSKQKNVGFGLFFVDLPDKTQSWQEFPRGENLFQSCGVILVVTLTE